MELSLKEAIGILDVVKTLDWYSVWLWLSIILPAYYVAYRKIIPDKASAPVQNENRENIPFPDKDIKPSLLKRIRAVLALPRIEPLFLYISVTLFTLGTIILIIGQKEKESIRNKGWALKNYMVTNYYYKMSLLNVSRSTKISEKEVTEIANQYPNEIAINYSADDNKTVVLVEGELRKQLLDRSAKLLDSYLSNPYVLKVGPIISFDKLFQQNNAFTYDVIYKLIIESNSRYTFNVLDTSDYSKGFGIAKTR